MTTIFSIDMWVHSPNGSDEAGRELIFWET